MTTDAEVRAILASYPDAFRPQNIQPLGNAGGFSGARFWRVEAPAGTFCLKRWPHEHATPERLQFIHAALNHVHRQGTVKVPYPITNRDQRTFVVHNDFFWELTPWIAGKADYRESPSHAKLSAAFRSLAQFHVSAATLAGLVLINDVSPGIMSRREQLRELTGGGTERISAVVHDLNDWPGLADRALRLLQLFSTCAAYVDDKLCSAANICVTLQPCIRDVWHDHVLFVGDEVSGIIDFDAMRIDTVACDVARLLGSLAGDDADACKRGIDSYRAERPLSSGEIELVHAFDCSTVLMAGMNWLRWIYVDGRRFDDHEKVVVRIDETLARLEHLKNQIGLHGVR